MGMWCLHASWFLDNKDMFKSFKRFDFCQIQTNHYENTPMQHTAIFHGCKNDNFQLNFLTVFIFLL